MKIIIDTNIAFSAILNTNSRIGAIILQPGSKLNFYSTEQLYREIREHRQKLKALSGYSDEELDKITELITSRIRFINPRLISKKAYAQAESLCREVDIDDTEFVALTEHLKGHLWSGDKELQKGLKNQGWNKFLSTTDLVKMAPTRKRKYKIL